MFRKIKKQNIFDFTMYLSAYLYFVIPISVFLFGWLKIVWAIPAFFILVAGMILSLKNDYNYIVKITDQYNALKWLSAFFIIAVWIFFSGIGGFSFQTEDHLYRNAIFHDLIDFSWPVIYDYTGQPEIHRLAGHQGGLVYYLAFWLPSAVVGKLSNWKIANFFLYIWSVSGVFLFFYFTSRYLKKLSLAVLFLIIFWSGLDIIGRLLFGSLPHLGEHLEWWTGEGLFQYSSNTTTIYWVFNQTIPAWLSLLLILNQRNTASIIFICSLAFPFAPFPFIGMLPFILYYFLFGKNDTSINIAPSFKESIALSIKNIKTCLTFQNIIVSVMILIIFGIFFLSNTNNQNINQAGIIWKITGGRLALLKIIIKYMVFCFLEFGIYYIILIKEYRKEPLYIISFISLLFIPWYKCGIFNDSVMRVSIPSLIILMIYVLRYFIENGFKLNQDLRWFCMAISIVIGGITPCQEIINSINFTLFKSSNSSTYDLKTLSTIDETKLDALDTYITRDPKKAIFFKHLSRMK